MHSAYYSYLQNRWGFFAAPIHDSLETFWVPYIWNLKHLRKRKLQLLITTYLQISWHNMNLKLTLGIQFDCIGQWFDQVAFSKNCILVCKLYTAHLPNLLRTNVNFIGGVKVDISSKKLHTRNYFLEKSRDRIHDVIYRPHLSIGILNVSFQLTPCRGACISYAWTSNCELCMYRCFRF